MANLKIQIPTNFNNNFFENKQLKEDIKRECKKASFFLMDTDLYKMYLNDVSLEPTQRTFMTLDFYLNIQYKKQLKHILAEAKRLNELQYKF
jgi:hypothetical protein